MAWSDDPKIRDLEPYCKRHGYAFVVVMAVHEHGKAFDTNTYGRNRKLCKAAAIAGEQLSKLVLDGTWPNWPDEITATAAFVRKENLAQAMEAYRKAFYHIFDNFNKLVTAAKFSDIEVMEGVPVRQWASKVRQAVSDCIEGRSV